MVVGIESHHKLGFDEMVAMASWRLEVIDKQTRCNNSVDVRIGQSQQLLPKNANSCGNQRRARNK